MAPGTAGTGFPQKIDVTTCEKQEPHHPCDPPLPCDPTKEPEGTCNQPFLCFERLKNPEENEHTRCKPGASIGVRNCAIPEKQHLCDDPKPCNLLPKPKKEVCDDRPLCKEKIKNLETPGVRRVCCIDSKGKVVEKILRRDA